MRRFLRYWLPVLVWLAVIFGASSDQHSYEHSSSIVTPLLHWLFPHMPDAQIDSIHHILRKCCHLTEYAILGLLIFRALRHSRTDLPPWSWPRVGGTILLVFLYACTDEFHQRYVPTRTPLFSDVLIDTGGGTFGVLLAWAWHSFRRPKAEK